MVKITQKSFNVEMESYLAKRKSDKPVKKTKEKPKKEVEVEEFHEEEKKYYPKSFIDKILDLISGEKPEHVEEDEGEEHSEELEKEEEFDELDETPRQSLIDKIKSWLMFQDVEDIDDDMEPLVEEEIKEVLKIQNKWLSKLSASKIKEFKESGDYNTYKEFLKKYKLIKKKD